MIVIGAPPNSTKRHHKVSFRRTTSHELCPDHCNFCLKSGGDQQELWACPVLGLGKPSYNPRPDRCCLKSGGDEQEDPVWNVWDALWTHPRSQGPDRKDADCRPPQTHHLFRGKPIYSSLLSLPGFLLQYIFYFPTLADLMLLKKNSN